MGSSYHKLSHKTHFGQKTHFTANKYIHTYIHSHLFGNRMPSLLMVTNIFIYVSTAILHCRMIVENNFCAERSQIRILKHSVIYYQSSCWKKYDELSDNKMLLSGKYLYWVHYLKCLLLTCLLLYMKLNLVRHTK